MLKLYIQFVSLQPFQTYSSFRHYWDVRTSGDMLEALVGNDPQAVKIPKNTCLQGTSLSLTASSEPSCVRIEHDVPQPYVDVD